LRGAIPKRILQAAIAIAGNAFMLLVQRFHETDRLHGLRWDSLVRWPVVALFFDSLDEIEDHGGMAAGI
jgi:hypothetical protein